MRVTLQATLGVAKVRLITGEVPDDEGMVATCGKQHVGAATPLAFSVQWKFARLPRIKRTSPERSRGW